MKSPKRMDLHLQFDTFFNSIKKLLINDIKEQEAYSEKKIKEKIVNSDTYLQNLIHYIWTIIL